jgi:nucleoside-diphosphate-sugar epimerase
MKFLVTGASGFIGASLCRHLLDAGHAVRAAASTLAPADDALQGLGLDARHAKAPEWIQIERSCRNPAAWQAACQGVDAVFHLAGRAHRAAPSVGARAVYRRDHLEVTQALAKAAIHAGVRRFLFMSSTTVYGAHSLAGQAFREDSPTASRNDDPYAISKRETEIFLGTPEINAALAPTIIRLPLVYGAGVKGNMRLLLRLVDRGIPLPLASVENRRSFVNLPNLVDFLRVAALDEKARGQTLLVSDNEDVSTPTLIRAIALGLGKKARLFAVPPGALRVVGGILGQGARCNKLIANFQIDATHSRDLLNWRPQIGFAEGVAKMCAAFHDSKQSCR